MYASTYLRTYVKPCAEIKHASPLTGHLTCGCRPSDIASNYGTGYAELVTTTYRDPQHSAKVSLNLAIPVKTLGDAGQRIMVNKQQTAC